MDEGRIRRRIQKALALASNNPSEEEAKTALLQAQRLMLTHNISEDEFLHDNNKKKEIVETEATDYKRLYWYEKRLSHVIAENFRCYRFWRGKGHRNKIIFFGLKEDTEIASDVYRYAITYMNSLCDSFIKENNLTHDRVARSDYRLGFIDGLESQLSEQVQEYGLILVKDPDVVDEYNEKEKTFRLFRDRTPTSIDRLSNYHKGQEDGLSFDYKRKQID